MEEKEKDNKEKTPPPIIKPEELEEQYREFASPPCMLQEFEDDFED